MNKIQFLGWYSIVSNKNNAYKLEHYLKYINGGRKAIDVVDDNNENWCYGVSKNGYVDTWRYNDPTYEGMFSLPKDLVFIREALFILHYNTNTLHKIKKDEL